MELNYDKIHFYDIGNEERKDIIEKIRRIVVEEKRILLAMIFGSFTRRNSVRDIDLCVYSATPLGLRGLLGLNAKIEFDLGLPVDLVELTYLPMSLKLKVLKQGILVKGDETIIHQLEDQVYSELKASIEC